MMLLQLITSNPLVQHGILRDSMFVACGSVALHAMMGNHCMTICAKLTFLQSNADHCRSVAVFAFTHQETSGLSYHVCHTAVLLAGVNACLPGSATLLVQWCRVDLQGHGTACWSLTIPAMMACMVVRSLQPGRLSSFTWKSPYSAHGADALSTCLITSAIGGRLLMLCHCVQSMNVVHPSWWPATISLISLPVPCMP